MKKVKLLLPIISMLALGSCSKLEDVSLGEIPAGGKQINYETLKANVDFKDDKDGAIMSIYDSEFSMNQSETIFNLYTRETREIFNKISVSNVNASISVKESLQKEAEIDFNALTKKESSEDEIKEYNLNLKAYVKDNKIYESFNEDFMNLLNLKGNGKYYQDMNEETKIDTGFGSISLTTTNSSFDNDLAASLAYSYLSMNNPYMKEVKMDVNGYPSWLSDDDTLLLGYSNNYYHEYVAYMSGDKIRVGYVINKFTFVEYPFTTTYMIKNELIENSYLALPSQVYPSSILGKVIAVKDNQGNLKNIYNTFDGYKELYQDCDETVSDIINSIFDIYQYKDEFLLNLDISKESLIDSINSLFTSLKEKENLYVLFGEVGDKEDTLKQSIIDIIESLLNENFYFKSTITLGKYGLSKVMLDFRYCNEQFISDGHEDKTYLDEVLFKFNAKFEYKNKMKINYPDFSEYVKFN